MFSGTLVRDFECLWKFAWTSEPEIACGLKPDIPAISNSKGLKRAGMWGRFLWACNAAEAGYKISSRPALIGLLPGAG